MRQAKTKAMLAYWMDLFSAAGNVPGQDHAPVWPERSSVVPTDCRSLLGDMFVLDTSRPQPTFRLAGTRLCALFGEELRGSSFSATFQPEDQRVASTWPEQLHEDEGVVVMSSRMANANGETLAVETLLMPMTNNGLAGQRVLGITVPCATPYWLGEVPVLNQALKSVRVLRPWRDGAADASVDSALPFVPSPPIAPQPDALRRVRHLTVLQGGRV